MRILKPNVGIYSIYVCLFTAHGALSKTLQTPLSTAAAFSVLL